VAGRLDAEQIEILRAWGAGLADDPRDEVRAAGKAITLLVDEIDRLNVDLWNLRASVPVPVAEPVRAAEPAKAAPRPAPSAAAQHATAGIFKDDPVFGPLPQPSLGATLRDRLRRRKPDEGSGPAPLTGEPGQSDS
jgi:hypothetical protein